MSMFDDALKKMIGDTTPKSENEFSLTINSPDMDILDYIVVQLCQCLDTKKLAFHGGYVLNKIIDKEKPRYTTDIDISVADTEYYANVKSVLCSAGNELIKHGIIERYEVKDIATVECSGGIDMYRTNNNRKLGADIGLRRVKEGTVPIYLSGIEARRFSICRMLSDKLRALHSPVGIRRTKDLYDVYIITNCFDVDMDELGSCIDDDGGIDISMSPSREDICNNHKHAYKKLRIDRSIDRAIVENKVEFDVVIKRVVMFACNINTGVLWKCSDRTFIPK